jgi:hypothetical protein
MSKPDCEIDWENCEASDCDCECACYACAVFEMDEDKDVCSSVHGMSLFDKNTPLFVYHSTSVPTPINSSPPTPEQLSPPMPLYVEKRQSWNNAEDVLFYLFEHITNMNWTPLEISSTLANCSLVARGFTCPAQTVMNRYPRFSNKQFDTDWHFNYTHAVDRAQRMAKWALGALDHIQGKSRCLDLSTCPMEDHRTLWQREDYHLLMRALHKSPSIAMASRLTKLSLAYWQPAHQLVDETAFPSIFANLVSLTHLDMQGVAGTWDLLESITTLPLVFLNLNKSWWVEDALAPAFHWVQQDDWIPHFNDDIGPVLEKVLKVLGKRLKYLGVSLEGNFVTASMAIQLLECLGKNLEGLDFNLSIRRDLGPVVDGGGQPETPILESIPPDAVLNGERFSLLVCKKLVHLELDSVELPGACMDDEGLAHFLTNPRPLSRLVCRGSWNVGESVAPYLSVLGPVLHGVSMESSPGSALAHALHVQHSRNCRKHRHLTHLDFSGCSSFSRESCRDLLRVLVSHNLLDHVQTLGVPNSTSDDHLVPLRECKNLSSLFALECRDVTNVTLHRLCWHAIHELDLRGCVQVTDAGIYSFCKARFSRLSCPLKLAIHPADQQTFYPAVSKGVKLAFLKQHFAIEGIKEAKFILTKPE